MCKGHTIGIDDLPPRISESAAGPAPPGAFPPRPLKEAMEEPEKRIIEAALRANGWNRQHTAKTLNVNRTTLYKKMKRYGLDADPLRAK